MKLQPYLCPRDPVSLQQIRGTWEQSNTTCVTCINSLKGPQHWWSLTLHTVVISVAACFPDSFCEISPSKRLSEPPGARLPEMRLQEIFLRRVRKEGSLRT
ncbi:hypothetical protein WJX79_006152 [Trebouxia sp. C0005]